jgi:hypothetical protein
MAYFQTKTPNFGKFWWGDVVIFYDHLVYFTPFWYILWPFGIFCGHLVYFVAIWYILWPFGIFYLVGIFYTVLVCTCTGVDLINQFRS